MGWRAQQSREDDEDRKWRSLPLRERYDWGAIATLVGTLAAALGLMTYWRF